MAFNNVGPVTSIAPGETIFWSYSYGGDAGFQHAGADIKTPGSSLMAFDQAKKIENNGNVNYFVSIRNDGPVSGAAQSARRRCGMTMTLITNDKCKLVASVQGAIRRTAVTAKGAQPGVVAVPVPGPGQKALQVEVPDDLAELGAAELHEQLKKFLKQG